MIRADNERVLVVQLFGARPQTMAEAATMAIDHGADVVDINMGCPVKKIIRTGAGVALMRNPDQAARIVASVVKAVPSSVPVTVKMRAGWDDGVNAVQLARLVVEAGARLVTVHARTREQFHGGAADWSIIGEVKQAVAVPVIGNGGVRSPEDADAMIEQTGCDAVMIGRAAMGNPWIFRSIRAGTESPPTLAERFDVIVRHLDLHERACQTHARPIQMRKHLAWYLRGLAGSAFIRNELNHLETIEQMRQMVQRYHDALLARQDSPAAAEDGT
jgi:nifR3 family TIM-barrel protein